MSFKTKSIEEVGAWIMKGSVMKWCTFLKKMRLMVRHSCCMKKYASRRGIDANACLLTPPKTVTEPEAVGVPGWQTGAKALCLYS